MNEQPANVGAHQHRRRVIPWLVFVAAILLSAFIIAKLAGQEPEEIGRSAPEFTQIDQWFNSEGLTMASLKGKVVILHFWTSGCINCQRNLPYYNQWFKDFADADVQIVGVHTPETRGETNLNTVATQVKRLRIKYPVAVDGASVTWKAYDNHYWPSIYLIDRNGQIRYRWVGELDRRDTNSDGALRAKIKELIAEPAK